MLNLGNIRPGGRYLAVDDASGLIVSGILERMGGQSVSIHICRFAINIVIQVKVG